MKAIVLPSGEIRVSRNHKGASAAQTVPDKEAARMNDVRSFFIYRSFLVKTNVATGGPDRLWKSPSATTRQSYEKDFSLENQLAEVIK